MKKVLFVVLTSLVVNFKISANCLINIVVNPKTCKNCMYYFTEIKLIDSSTNIKLTFTNELTDQQLEAFVKEKFPSNFNNYTIERNDSLVDFIFSLNDDYNKFGAVALINDSNEIVVHFVITEITKNLKTIERLTKNKKVVIEKHDVNEISSLIGIPYISDNGVYKTINTDDNIFLYSKENKLLKTINFSNEVKYSFFYNKMHHSTKKLELFLKEVRTSKFIKPISFIASKLINNNLYFTFVFDSFFVKNKETHFPPKFFLGNYDIIKDSFSFTPINDLFGMDYFIDGHYFEIDNNKIVISLNFIEKGIKKSNFATYSKLNNRYCFKHFEKLKINTMKDKYGVLFPMTLFINEESLIHYESLTFYSRKNGVNTKLKTNHFMNLDSTCTSILYSDLIENIIYVVSFNKDKINEFFFNEKGQQIHRIEHLFPRENYFITSNTEVKDGEFTFINNKNELVKITFK